MATLTIRNLPEDVRDRLRVRAARNGRSTEAEVRSLIAEAVGAEASGARPSVEERVKRLQERVAAYIPPGSYSVDAFLAEKRQEAQAEEERWRGREAEATEMSSQRRRG